MLYRIILFGSLQPPYKKREPWRFWACHGSWWDKGWDIFEMSRLRPDVQAQHSLDVATPSARPRVGSHPPSKLTLAKPRNNEVLPDLTVLWRKSSPLLQVVTIARKRPRHLDLRLEGKCGNDTASSLSVFSGQFRP